MGIERPFIQKLDASFHPLKTCARKAFKGFAHAAAVDVGVRYILCFHLVWYGGKGAQAFPLQGKSSTVITNV